MRLGIFWLICLGLIAGCGGGGSSSSSPSGDPPAPIPTSNPPSGNPSIPPANSNPEGLNFEPSSWIAESYQGDVLEFDVKVKLDSPLQGRVNVRIVDKQGVLYEPPAVKYIDQSTVSAKLILSPKLAPKSYKGSFVISFCVDDPSVCQQPYSQASWSYPYQLLVHPLPNLTALSPLSKGSDWATVQGNAAHNGYVPEKLDSSKFALRFRYAPEHAQMHGPMVTKDGFAVFTTRSGGAYEFMHALDENKGVLAWLKPIGAGNVPLIMGDDVLYYPGYISNAGFGIIALNLATGAVRNSVTKLADEGVYDNGALYFSYTRDYLREGYFVDKLSGLDLTPMWDSTESKPESRPRSMRVPALDANFSYYYEGDTRFSSAPSSRLAKLDKKSGKTVASIYMSRVSAFDSNRYVSPPVICNSQSILISDGSGPDSRIRMVDLEKNALRYELAGNYSSEAPVCDRSMFYVVGASGLEARRISDGSLAWILNPPAGEKMFDSFEKHRVSNLVLFDNIIFVSFGENLYGIELTSKEPVWVGKRMGGRKLTVSKNGVLYAAEGSSSYIHAFNLH